MAESSVATVPMFAVCYMGQVSGDADVLSFKLGSNERIPVPIYINESEAKCEKMLGRLRARFAKIVSYVREDCKPATPILAVLAVNFRVPRSKVVHKAEPSDNGETAAAGRKPKARK